MKYARGTVLKWSEKAKRNLKQKASDSDRMIVLNNSTVVWYIGDRVHQTDMGKRQDSYVVEAGESIPKGLKINRRDMSNDPDIDKIVSEFGFVFS